MLARTLPPAGTVLGPKDLVILLKPSGPKNRRLSLESAITSAFEGSTARLFSSGRAAMTVILEAMAEARPDRKTVLVPGYTCFSVAASILRAGLRVRPVDVDLTTLSYSPIALAEAYDPGVLCILSGNLFGSPDDLPFLEGFAAARGIFFLDDAAQALYATVGERWAGSFGDVGIFSLDKGKNITTMEGGAALIRNPELMGIVDRRWRQLPNRPIRTTPTLLAKLLVYAVFLRPSLYTLPARALPLGKTPFETSFPIAKYSSLLAPLAERLLARVEEITEARRVRAEWIHNAIPSTPLIAAPTATSDGAVHLRFPLVLADQEIRDRALMALSAAGLGATRFYPTALNEIPELQDSLDPNSPPTPNARALAHRILTLPTHEYVEMRDVRRMGEILDDIVQTRSN